MHNNEGSKSLTPTTAQLITALQASEPSDVRDLGIHLLETGQVNAESPLADLSKALREYRAVR